MSDSQIDRSRGEQGFSLIELLVVIVLLGLLAVWGIPTLLSTLNRTRLVGASKEIATLMQVGRLEAIKKGGVNGDLQGRVVALRYNAGQRSFDLLLDDTADGIFNPSTPILGTYHLPTGVYLRAPSEAEEGTGSIDGWDDPGADSWPGPIFVSDGSVRRAGAYRIYDSRANYLEVRVDFPATGKVVIQKWFPLLTDWFENGEGENYWQW